MTNIIDITKVSAAKLQAILQFGALALLMSRERFEEIHNDFLMQLEIEGQEKESFEAWLEIEFADQKEAERLEKEREGKKKKVTPAILKMIIPTIPHIKPAGE